MRYSLALLCLTHALACSREAPTCSDKVESLDRLVIVAHGIPEWSRTPYPDGPYVPELEAVANRSCPGLRRSAQAVITPDSYGDFAERVWAAWRAHSPPRTIEVRLSPRHAPSWIRSRTDDWSPRQWMWIDRELARTMVPLEFAELTVGLDLGVNTLLLSNRSPKALKE